MQLYAGFEELIQEICSVFCGELGDLRDGREFVAHAWLATSSMPRECSPGGIVSEVERTKGQASVLFGPDEYPVLLPIRPTTSGTRDSDSRSYACVFLS